MTVQFPSGQVVTSQTAAASSGKVTVPVAVPLDAYVASSTGVTATVASTTQGLTRTGTVAFALSLPRLQLFFRNVSVHTGHH